MLAKLHDVAEISAGFPFRGAIRPSQGADTIVVQMKDVDPQRGVDWASATRSALPGKKEPDWLREGDILFAARGSRNHSIMVEHVPGKAVCSPHFFVLRLREPSKITAAFLAWQLNQEPSRKYFEQNATGSYILNIRRQVLEQLQIVITDRAQQELIVALDRSAHMERIIMERLIANRKSQLEAVARSLQTTLGGAK